MELMGIIMENMCFFLSPAYGDSGRLEEGIHIAYKTRLVADSLLQKKPFPPWRNIHSWWVLNHFWTCQDMSDLSSLEEHLRWWIDPWNFHWIAAKSPWNHHFWRVFHPPWMTGAASGYLAPFDSVTEQLRAKMEVAAKPKEEVEEEERWRWNSHEEKAGFMTDEINETMDIVFFCLVMSDLYLAVWLFIFCQVSVSG